MKLNEKTIAAAFAAVNAYMEIEKKASGTACCRALNAWKESGRVDSMLRRQLLKCRTVRK
ncbi:MAG: hypothetical protein WCQ99_10180 [Pseudomonadota bacterium]